MSNTIDDRQLPPDAPNSRILGDYTPAKDAARELNKHETTLLRRLPRELVLYVGKTPFVHVAGTRDWLLAGGKPGAIPPTLRHRRRLERKGVDTA